MGEEGQGQLDNKVDVVLGQQGSGEGKLSRVLAKPRFYKEVHGRPCWEGFRGLTEVEVSSEPQACCEQRNADCRTRQSFRFL